MRSRTALTYGMDKEQLTAAIAEGLTHRQIADRIGRTSGFVQSLLRRHGLRTIHAPCNRKPTVCQHCGATDPAAFYLRHPSCCRGCHIRIRGRKRRELKARAVAYKGGRCVSCGYDRCPGAMDFHHRDPASKETDWKVMRAWSWNRITNELDKCDLLCKVCHAERHWDEEEAEETG